jgi:hypothetical protein
MFVFYLLNDLKYVVKINLITGYYTSIVLKGSFFIYRFSVQLAVVLEEEAVP